MSDNSSTHQADFDSYPSVITLCLDNGLSNLIFTAFTITNFLLVLPLPIITLFLGYQQWRRKRSTPISHSDFFTFHLVVMEMIHILASGGYCIGFYIDHKMMKIVMTYFFYISSCGQISFHTLTCVERYLAVVFPITYMRANKGSGVWIRNAFISLVWLLFVALTVSVVSNTLEFIIIVHTVQQALSLTVICFCSFAVLRVLKRSVPGDGSRDREKVDQLKQRAFNTIMAIMGALLLSFGGCMVYAAMYITSHISKSDQCVIMESSFWLRLPSSVVLPLLFLHRSGKITCGRKPAEAVKR